MTTRRPVALLSAAAHERHRTLLDATIGDRVEWLPMTDDGGLSDGAEPTVAWFTPDLVQATITRPFFGFVQHCPTLEFVQSSYTGTDSGVFRSLVERGVTLCNAHVTAGPIAEFVLGAVLNHHQDHAGLIAAQEQRIYRKRNFTEVSGSTWLIVGFGHIGQEIARRAQAFGARVVGVRRSPTPTPLARVVTPERIDDHLPGADVVILALPSSAGTDLLIDERRLALMGPDSLLVNVGRPNAIDHDALRASLDRGRPGAAILDVQPTEPLPADDPLWAHPRIRISPHTSAGGLGRFRRGAELFVDNLDRWLTGRPLRNLVGSSDR